MTDQPDLPDVPETPSPPPRRRRRAVGPGVPATVDEPSRESQGSGGFSDDHYLADRPPHHDRG